MTTVLQPAHDPTTTAAFTYAEVKVGEVGQSLNLNVVARWRPIVKGVNEMSGVATTVDVTPGGIVGPGTRLYTVDLRPVVVAQGAIPSFRTIVAGTKGGDVAQLQTMLGATGHYRGSIDGVAGVSTVSAIKRWQRASGVPATGVVEVGDIIYLPALPVRVVLDEKAVAPGNRLSGGEPVVQILPGVPDFSLPVTAGQAAAIPSGTPVMIANPRGGVWRAKTGEQTVDSSTQNATVALVAPTKDAICGADCDAIPIRQGETLLDSDVVVVPPTKGLVVPSAALATSGADAVVVIDTQGKRLPVKVVASARGMSVVEGVRPGTRVRVPAGGNVPK